VLARSRPNRPRYTSRASVVVNLQARDQDVTGGAHVSAVPRILKKSIVIVSPVSGIEEQRERKHGYS